MGATLESADGALDRLLRGTTPQPVSGPDPIVPRLHVHPQPAIEAHLVFGGPFDPVALTVRDQAAHRRGGRIRPSY